MGVEIQFDNKLLDSKCPMTAQYFKGFQVSKWRGYLIIGVKDKEEYLLLRCSQSNDTSSY
jgi:hypothetical protein